MSNISLKLSPAEIKALQKTVKGSMKYYFTKLQSEPTNEYAPYWKTQIKHLNRTNYVIKKALESIVEQNQEA